ncbi:hypothetical protein ANN_14261 [Periplaneta americana]|uniref:CCHC-type domain-containing protein n=1 Tax=Periplaneta americana TaxID=6978 RepID=A0ABQ8SWX0_PERAM|nr:hypothetical protein ANN_14261 [Periplaneta americana]
MILNGPTSRKSRGSDQEVKFSILAQTVMESTNVFRSGRPLEVPLRGTNDEPAQLAVRLTVRTAISRERSWKEAQPIIDIKSVHIVKAVPEFGRLRLKPTYDAVFNSLSSSKRFEPSHVFMCMKRCSWTTINQYAYRPVILAALLLDNPLSCDNLQRDFIGEPVEADADGSVGGQFQNGFYALFFSSFKKTNKKHKTRESTTGAHMTKIAMELDPEKVTVKVPPPKFISITLDGTEKTMKNISPFYVRRALDGLVGKVKNATRLRNGSLLVETVSLKQSETLLKAKLLGSYPIKVERHSSLNTTRGVVHTDSLDGMSDEEIQLELAEQSVSKAYRLLRKRDGQTIPLSTVFLTFEKPVLPEYILVGYERVPVRAYVPNPMRCFRCQRFGHTQKRCTNNIVCFPCAAVLTMVNPRVPAPSTV